jgi:hypothetical protein
MGKSLGGEFDTVSGSIKLNMDIPLQYRAGFRAEELFHFYQVHSGGLLGRELSGLQIEGFENEVVGELLNNGFEIAP